MTTARAYFEVNDWSTKLFGSRYISVEYPAGAAYMPFKYLHRYALRIWIEDNYGVWELAKTQPWHAYRAVDMEEFLCVKLSSRQMA